MTLGVENKRPRATLGGILDGLGGTLLNLVLGSPSGAEHVGGVSIWDPADQPDLPRGAVVLGVALLDKESIAGTLRELGTREAVALVLRAPVPESQVIAEAAAESGVVVLGLTRGASWTQLAAMLRSLLAEDSVGQVESATLGGVESGDLFALANAITALLDAPVTIEDCGSRVLAFSGRQGEADRQRVDVILGRRVPEQATRVYLERGVFRELYRSDQPVWIEPDELGANDLPRVAIAVRAGDEVLGSIWAAVREPLSEERSQALVEAAKVAALHLLRVRSSADVERRLRSDLVSTALEGGPEAHEAISRLGLSNQAVVLFALELLDRPEDEHSLAVDTTLQAERMRISDAFTVHLAALSPRSASAFVGNMTYGLVPASRCGATAEERAVQMANEFLGLLGRRVRAVIGIGPVARTPTELAYSRTTVGRVLRVLRARNGAGQRAASLADVHFDALLLELRDLAAARGDRITGPITKLMAYDAEHKTNLVETLSAWFDAFGDVPTASAAISIHPNTFRYRLRRISDLGGVNLSEPSTRLAMMLQLQILRGLPVDGQAEVREPRLSR
ncbi:PucR family transcriptional regulator [Streptomyces sp. NPDC004752]